MFSDDYLQTPEVPDALPSLELLHEQGHELFVISKCGDRVEQRSREWLQARDFSARTGAGEDRWHFVRERPDKAPLAERLRLDAFVDDNAGVVRSMVPVVRTAVLLRPEVSEHPLPDGVLQARSWAEVLELPALTRHTAPVTEPQPYEVVARNIDPAADNRIHDDDVAQRFGFQGALVPGVELFAYVTSPLVAAWGVDWCSAGTVSLRFRRPVYDGERVVVRTEPTADGAYALTLVGPDGTVRSVGAASRAGRTGAPPDLADAPLPAQLRLPRPEALPDGPFGTITEPLDQAAVDAYCDAVDEPLELYRSGVVHPGQLLRLVNAALMRNVALGPWVHTASSCRWHGAARVPAVVTVRSAVTGRTQRNGHEYVTYDALVLADGAPVLEVAHEAIYALAG